MAQKEFENNLFVVVISCNNIYQTELIGMDSRLKSNTFGKYYKFIYKSYMQVH